MGIDMYPAMLYEGDLTPDNIGPEADAVCHEIRAACKGFGTNEDRLLKAMGSMTPEIRCKVPIRYKEMYDKPLKDVMKKECGNRDFGTALQLLAADPIEAECDMIHRSCKGLGTDEHLLYTIICGRSNKDIDILKKKYFDLHTKDLGRILDAELGGDFEKLIFTVFQASEEEYDPGFHTDEKMAKDAKALYDMGQGKFGTNEAGLFKVLVNSPPEYLKKLNLVYAEKYGYTLAKALETELRGKARNAAIFTMGMKLKPYETVAKLIDEACKGFGTNELLLTSTLIRYQPIMKEVAVAFVELYGETIEDKVKSETRGDYEKLLKEVMAVSAAL